MLIISYLFCYHYFVINPSVFRAYDIRGVYQRDFDEDGFRMIASVLADKFFRKGKIVVAHDARKSSLALYESVIAALGPRAIKAGPATTPMFYFTVISERSAGGIMITASHNPPEWNGMKVVGPKASPINGFDIKKIMEK